MTARPLIGAALAAAALIPAAGAHAAGLPIASSQSSRIGATTPGGTVRVTAKRAGSDTVLTRGATTNRIPGRWNIPAASLDNQTTGLSGNGKVLVLVHRTRSFPSKNTRILVLDARRLEIQRQIHLKGFFTVDAISPDGAWAYLIQYAGSGNLLDYRVRALNTATSQLRAKDVVDPREPDEKIGGMPYTRVRSPEGQWAYTLYGGGEEAFIHALDTVNGTAACIDLDMFAPTQDLSQAKLKLTKDGLVVFNRGQRVAVVNTTTFAVRDTSAPEPVSTIRPTATPTPTAARTSAPDDGGFPWIVIPIAAVVAALAAFGLRPRPATPSEQTFESRRT